MERSFNEQYERLSRSYKKCISHSQWGDSPKLPYYGSCDDIQSIEDDFIHFFQDCLNLRDWITKDSKIPDSVKKKVTQFYKSEDCLRWARDLANATKHLKIDPKQASISENVDIERVGMGYAFGTSPIGVPPYSCLYVGIRTKIPGIGVSRLIGEKNGTAMEAEDLAILCKSSIDNLLKECKLIGPSSMF